MSSDDDDSDLEYSVTFECDCHGELTIDYELVEVTNNDKVEFGKQNYMNED
ncbi:12085_t:CDS:1, partial [Racocetra persica]